MHSPSSNAAHPELQEADKFSRREELSWQDFPEDEAETNATKRSTIRDPKNFIVIGLCESVVFS